MAATMRLSLLQAGPPLASSRTERSCGSWSCRRRAAAAIRRRCGAPAAAAAASAAAAGTPGQPLEVSSLVGDDGGPPRFLSPLPRAAPAALAGRREALPLLVYLPGIDGTGLAARHAPSRCSFFSPSRTHVYAAAQRRRAGQYARVQLLSWI